MEEENVKTSKYSGAVAKEIRRQDLWKDANRHSRSGKYCQWNEDLDCIWSELSADLNEVKYKEKKLKLDEFETRLVNAGEMKDNYNPFEGVSEEQKKIRTQHYKILREKEEFLRRLENELGKGTIWSDEDEDLM